MASFPSFPIIRFPPQINIEEIARKQLDKNITNINKTPNAFMIYRREFSRAINKYQPDAKLINVSKLAGESWKGEPQFIKDYYKQKADDVKNYFKQHIRSLYFVPNNKPTRKRRKTVKTQVNAATSKNISFFNNPIRSPSLNRPSHILNINVNTSPNANYFIQSNHLTNTYSHDNIYPYLIPHSFIQPSQNVYEDEQYNQLFHNYASISYNDSINSLFTSEVYANNDVPINDLNELCYNNNNNMNNL